MQLACFAREGLGLFFARLIWLQPKLYSGKELDDVSAFDRFLVFPRGKFHDH